MPIRSVLLPNGEQSNSYAIVYYGNLKRVEQVFTPTRHACACHDQSPSSKSPCSSSANWSYPPPYQWIVDRDAPSPTPTSLPSTHPAPQSSIANSDHRGVCEASSAFQFSGLDWKLGQQREAIRERIVLEEEWSERQRRREAEKQMLEENKIRDMKLAQRVMAEAREAKRRNSEAISAKEKRSSTKKMDSLRESSEGPTAIKSKMGDSRGEQESKSRETKTKNNRSESTNFPINEASNATNKTGSIKSKVRKNANNNNANINMVHDNDNKKCVENIRCNGFKRSKDLMRKRHRQGKVTDGKREQNGGQNRMYNSNNNNDHHDESAAPRRAKSNIGNENKNARGRLSTVIEAEDTDPSNSFSSKSSATSSYYGNSGDSTNPSRSYHSSSNFESSVTRSTKTTSDTVSSYETDAESNYNTTDGDTVEGITDESGTSTAAPSAQSSSPPAPQHPNPEAEEIKDVVAAPDGETTVKPVVEANEGPRENEVKDADETERDEERDEYKGDFTRYFKIVRSRVPLGGPAIFMQISKTAVRERD